MSKIIPLLGNVNIGFYPTHRSQNDPVDFGCFSCFGQNSVKKSKYTAMNE